MSSEAAHRPDHERTMNTDTMMSHEIRDVPPAPKRASAAGKGQAVAKSGDRRQNLRGRMVADLMTTNVQGQGGDASPACGDSPGAPGSAVDRREYEP